MFYSVTDFFQRFSNLISNSDKIAYLIHELPLNGVVGKYETFAEDITPDVLCLVYSMFLSQ